MFKVFGHTQEGEEIGSVTIANSFGTKAVIIEYGAVLQSLLVPDRHHQLTDIVLGYKTVSGYSSLPCAYLGAIVGRVAGRITNAQIMAGDGSVCKVTCNHGNCCLHGGIQGFSRRKWNIEKSLIKANSVTLSLISKAGEEGFPGEVKTAVTYELSNNVNELILTYSASTTETCPINMTNHSYFNLNGDGSPDIFDHVITIDAMKTPLLSSDLMPTGEVTNLKSCYLLKEPTALSKELVNSIGFDPPGFDAYYIFDNPSVDRVQARVVHPASGRVMELLTDQPGVQFYTSNFFDGGPHLEGKSSTGAYTRHSSFCLEAQSWPDATSHSSFPDIYVHPGKEYSQVTKYRFSTIA